MPTQMTEEEIYEAAKKRVEEKKGFRSHFIIYLCVNALLVIIWAVTGRGVESPGFSSLYAAGESASCSTSSMSMSSHGRLIPGR
jgi:hypothetical protein